MKNDSHIEMSVWLSEIKRSKKVEVIRCCTT